MIEFEVEGNNFHDGIIQNISIDFENKETSILLKQWYGDDHELTQLKFKKVQWQNFNDFSDFNILWGMDYTDSYEEFEDRENEYMERMRNYFPSGKIEDIKSNNNLKYYFLQSSSGLDGFVICEQLGVSELKEE
jgi:hypothetical protein